jgi:hypothetical protein
MIHNNNTILITTTIPRNIISETRRNNIVNNFSKWNIPILFNHGIIDKTVPSHTIMFTIIKNALESFKKYNSEYAIICDDDFFPIENFLEELNKTIELLPNNWRCLHLCPGYLWGRWFRDKTKISMLNPEYNMENISFDKSGRFYINCDNNLYFSKKFWLGGPIAMLVNKTNIESLLNDFILQYNKQKNNNDVILTQILNNNDYICRQPMLGYENEEGGSTFRLMTV